MEQSHLPQQESRLCNVPVEVRHAIYAYLIPEDIHLTLHDDTLHLLPCSREEDDDDGYYYKQQYQSLWSTHWVCESITKGRKVFPEEEGQKLPVALFLACKKM